MDIGHVGIAIITEGENMNKLNVWWWRKPGLHNFGDELGWHILKKMGHKINRVALANADLITSGTILDMADKRAKDGCTIWGSGIGWEHDIMNRFNVIALRGKISATSLGFDGVLGDPGLLVSRFWPKQPTKYGVGVVRHYVDKREFPWADIVIDATEPVNQVIDKISSCATICSSSLHGLIVADSFGIPTMRLDHPEVISGDIKWSDYQSALSKPITQIQDELLMALQHP